MIRKLFAWTISSLLITLTLFTYSVPTRANEDKVIRVGYPLLENLSMKDDDGNYYGYDFEYLEQIAQYTGWRYEFVEVDGDINTRLMTLLEMLENGEIDLLGSLNYSEKLAEKYDYASEPYGYSYDVLLARNDSDIYDQNSLLAKKDLKIAVHEKAITKSEKLNQFARMNGLVYEEIPSKRSVLNELDAGLADVGLSTDSNIKEGYHAVARFFPNGFYFATTKGNNEVINQLNQALISISQANPTFSTTLYNRYFTGESNQFILTDFEKQYIESHKTINVLARDTNAPIQYVNDGEVKGVAKDILDVVAEKTGVTFNYTVAKDYEDYVLLSNSGDFDVLLGVPYEIKASEVFNVSLTNPYFAGDFSLITKNIVDPNDLSALTEGKTEYTFKEYNAKQRSRQEMFDSVEDILIAINKEKVDYTYLNSYIATYYMNKNNLKDLVLFNVPDHIKSQYSFGVKKNSDFTLLRILNKAINTLDDDINSMIYKNASIEKEFSLSRYIQEHLLFFLFVVFLIVFVVILTIKRYYTRQIKMKKAVELEYKRYQLLYDITGEMTFVYNYLSDELKISNSGLSKLANESVIQHFTLTQKDKEPSNDVGYVIYSNIMEQEDVNREYELVLVNMEKNWYQFTMKLLRDVDKQSHHAIYAIGKILDIQKVVDEKEILIQNSMTDPLTGIWNRAGAYSLISDKLVSAETTGALVMLDLDNFKDVNDQFGHLDGDIVLQQTAQVLTSVFSDNIVARLGGDEFIIYMEEASVSMIKKRCQLAIERMKTIPYTQDKDIKVSMSMGVVLTDYSRDYEDLVRLADEQLYDIKRNGKNGFKIYNKE